MISFSFVDRTRVELVETRVIPSRGDGPKVHRWSMANTNREEEAPLRVPDARTPYVLKSASVGRQPKSVPREEDDRVPDARTLYDHDAMRERTFRIVTDCPCTARWHGKQSHRTSSGLL